MNRRPPLMITAIVATLATACSSGAESGPVGIVTEEVPVYESPFDRTSNVLTGYQSEPPGRIWTLPPNAKFTILCQARATTHLTDAQGSHELTKSFLKVKYAQGSGYILRASVVSVSRTSETNETIDPADIKSC